ncbi:MAG: hypothetical protein ABSH33_09545 [Steroidobacteraceae bacterium]
MSDLEGRFRRDYNRLDFPFTHQLAGNPLFDLDNLVEFTRRTPERRDHYWANGAAPVNNAWSDGTIGRQSLPDTLVNVEHNNSTVVLRHTERDPVFAPVLTSLVAAIIDLSGERMRADVRLGEVSILVGSPGRIPSYHMTAATRFLVQITGDRQVQVFDPSDRTLVTDRALEDFFAGGGHREPLRTDRPDDRDTHDVRAGYGVHVPACAPHWIRYGDTVSVALGVEFELRSVDRLAKLYRFNHGLRRLGLKPVPPNVSGWRDRIKLAAADGVAALRLAGKLGRGRRREARTPPAG